MKLIVGNYKASNNKNYYNIVLNLKTKEKILIKNASCSADAFDIASKYFCLEYRSSILNEIKIFFIGDDVALLNYLDRVPKKYKKFFKGA